MILHCCSPNNLKLQFHFTVSECTCTACFVEPGNGVRSSLKLILKKTNSLECTIQLPFEGPVWSSYPTLIFEERIFHLFHRREAAALCDSAACCSTQLDQDDPKKYFLTPSNSLISPYYITLHSSNPKICVKQIM